MSRLVALVLLLAAVTAPVLVASNVPDPTWIGGIYDGADADEILAFVWGQTPALVAAALVLDARSEARFDVLPLRVVATTLPSPSPSSRAPPRA